MLETGEYVRTQIYGISKVIKVVNNQVYLDNLGFGVKVKDIINHSIDITNLIEEGDFVNGEYVSKVMKNYITIGRMTYGREELKGIRTILTKEQYEANCYKVKEE